MTPVPALASRPLSATRSLRSDMQVICTDGTTFNCAGYELTKYGVKLLGQDADPEDDRYETDGEPIAYVPHDRLWYIIPDGVQPPVPVGAPQPMAQGAGQPVPQGAGQPAPEQPQGSQPAPRGPGPQPGPGGPR